jgi:hypothetical protein
MVTPSSDMHAMDWEQFRDEMYLVAGHGWAVHRSSDLLEPLYTHSDRTGAYTLQEALCIQRSLDAIEE